MRQIGRFEVYDPRNGDDFVWHPFHGAAVSTRAIGVLLVRSPILTRELIRDLTIGILGHHSSDLLAVVVSGVRRRRIRKIEESIGVESLWPNAYLSFFPYSEENRRRALECMMQLGQFEFWCFGALPESNRESVVSLPTREGWEVDSVIGELRLFEQLNLVNLDWPTLDSYHVNPISFDQAIGHFEGLQLPSP